MGLDSTGFTMGELTRKSNYAVGFSAYSFLDAVAGRFPKLPMDGMVELVGNSDDLYRSVLGLARRGQAILNEGKVDGQQVLSKEGVATTLTAHTIMHFAIRDPDLAPSQ